MGEWTRLQVDLPPARLCVVWHLVSVLHVQCLPLILLVKEGHQCQTMSICHVQVSQVLSFYIKLVSGWESERDNMWRGERQAVNIMLLMLPSHVFHTAPILLDLSVICCLPGPDPSASVTIESRSSCVTVRWTQLSRPSPFCRAENSTET